MRRATPRLPALPRPGLLAFLLLSAAACGPVDDAPPDAGPGCVTDADCKGERTCFDGACLFPEELATVAGAIGSACETHADCAGDDGRCYDGLPGGYCFVPDCEGGCRPGSACVETGEGGLCLKACEADGDCREGYACTDRLGPAVCHVAEGGGAAAPGESCAAPADCAGLPATCVTGWPEGYCAPYECVANGCPAGSTCHPESAIEVGGACLADCLADDDCRTGYVCRPTQVGGACVPDCTAADVCVEGETCEAESGHCAPAA